jgi:archaemetzincin
MPPSTSPPCGHASLTFSSSSQASVAGYKRPSLPQRITAITPQGTIKSVAAKQGITKEAEEASIFPAPLVLPEDELSWDPKWPPQSLQSWIREKDRNEVTPERRTVYLVPPPDLDSGLDFVRRWPHPKATRTVNEKRVDFPRTADVLSYLEAFYYGLPVKMLPSPNLCFTTDIDDSPTESKGKKKSSDSITKTDSKLLWLNSQTPSGCIGIRSRATPKGNFTHQLNLNDLLDAAIEILPSDAYALLMLVEHDIYEEEDDDFACGRAYGGSRVAVVSGARYNPVLDEEQGVEREHGWPASHCEAYLRRCCDKATNEDDEGLTRKSKKVKIMERELTASKEGAMHAALSAHLSLPTLSQAPSTATLSGLWLGRVCRTASHELGHCFGIDHCVYYACAMQGTANMIEDARQPPYLCPVDLAKVLRATGADEKARYEKLLQFCKKHDEAHLFNAFGAWIRGRIEISTEN